MAKSKSTTTARRAFLAGALATAALPAPAKSDVDRIQEATEDLAAAMAQKHGARYATTVDHETGFILIVQRPAA